MLGVINKSETSDHHRRAEGRGGGLVGEAVRNYGLDLAAAVRAAGGEGGGGG